MPCKVMHVCVDGCMYTCMYACMHGCVYACLFMWAHPDVCMCAPAVHARLMRCSSPRRPAIVCSEQRRSLALVGERVAQHGGHRPTLGGHRLISDRIWTTSSARPPVHRPRARHLCGDSLGRLWRRPIVACPGVWARGGGDRLIGKATGRLGGNTPMLLPHSKATKIPRGERPPRDCVVSPAHSQLRRASEAQHLEPEWLLSVHS